MRGSKPSSFLTALDSHQVSSPSSPQDTQLVLDSDLVFYDAETERYYVAPAGTVTDLASIPLILPGVAHLLLGGALASARAGVGHDAAYRSRLLMHSPAAHWAYRAGLLEPRLATLTRRQADALFYRMLRATGFNSVSAYAFWLGVRVGGLVSWRRGHKL